MQRDNSRKESGSSLFSKRNSNPFPSGRRRQNSFGKAYTLIEIVVSIALLITFAAIGIPLYQNYIEAARVNEAIAEINSLQVELYNYTLINRDPPQNLTDVSRGNILDPWGQPYQYYNITKNGIVGARKDGFLVPINSQFDLYSKGEDGETRLSLSHPASWDDVIFATDGGFIGLASGF